MKATSKKTAFVIRLGAIGDIMLITPILAALKRDGISVTLACKPHAQVLLRGTGLVDNWLLWTRELDEAAGATGPEEWKNAGLATDHCIELGRGHDYLINLVGVVEGQCMKKVWNFSKEFLASMPDGGAEIYKRFGMGQRDGWRPTNENHTDALFRAAGQDPEKYPDHLKRPVWRVLPDERKWARKKFKAWGITDRDFVVVYQLTGSRFSTLWPYGERFAQMAKAAMRNVKIIMLGYGLDEMACMEWAHKYPWVVPFAVGRTPATRDKTSGNLVYSRNPASLRQDGAICEAADVYVGPNSSFLHVSAAVGTPTVPLYTECNHEQIGRYYPHTYPVQSPVDCAPCGLILTTCDHGPLGFAKCMEAIHPQRVVQRVIEAKEETWDVGRKTA